MASVDDPGPLPPYPPALSRKRPGTVTAAVVITWLSSALMFAFTAGAFLLALADSDPFFDELMKAMDGDDREAFRAATLALTALGLGWAVAAMVLAWFALRGSQGARIGLAVSAGATVPVGLLMILALVPAVAVGSAITVIVLLFSGGANEWYRANRWRRGAGAGR